MELCSVQALPLLIMLFKLDIWFLTAKHSFELTVMNNCRKTVPFVSSPTTLHIFPVGALKEIYPWVPQILHKKNSVAVPFETVL